MAPLEQLENKSIYLIREAYARFHGSLALLWSMGKDSTALLWLARKAFLGRIPFPVLHIDTGYKFSEMYAFRDRLSKEWGFELIIGKNDAKLRQGLGPGSGLTLECCTELKTHALRDMITSHGFSAILLGIRRDEHSIRAKERYFSPRDSSFQWDYENQPAEIWDQYASIVTEEEHYRIHPLLHFSELDIWRYVQRESIPFVSLYLSNQGKRYRSIGCAPCCTPVESTASTIDEIIEEIRTSELSERAGRAQDKENLYTMQKLRSLGYM